MTPKLTFQEIQEWMEQELEKERLEKENDDE